MEEIKLAAPGEVHEGLLPEPGTRCNGTRRLAFFKVGLRTWLLKLARTNRLCFVQSTCAALDCNTTNMRDSALRPCLEI